MPKYIPTTNDELRQDKILHIILGIVVLCAAAAGVYMLMPVPPKQPQSSGMTIGAPTKKATTQVMHYSVRDLKSDDVCDCGELSVEEVFQRRWNLTSANKQ